MKKNLKNIMLCLGCLATIGLGFVYWHMSSLYEETNDAYVTADTVSIAPRVGGYVTHVYVTHNQRVTRGQILFTLDEAPFSLAIRMAQQKWMHDQITLQNASVNNQRMQVLVAHHYVSTQQAQQSLTYVRELKAMVKLDQLNVRTQQLNLSYATVRAPFSGWVTNIQLMTGDAVSQNQPLFAIISDQDAWIDANFKETQIGKIRAGQPVEIENDLYPGHRFHGVVASLSHGTGAAFALLPAENATGNWVKVVQRLPVRIRVIDHDPRFLLRVGTSTTVKVMTGA